MQKAEESDEVAEAVRRALDKPRYRLVDAIRAGLAGFPGSTVCSGLPAGCSADDSNLAARSWG